MFKRRSAVSAMSGTLLAVLICLFMGACGKTLMYVESLKPGGATLDEVRKRLPPLREWPLPGGGVDLEYAGDLYGEPGRRLEFAKDGLFVRWYRPATLERSEQIKHAMTRQEVLAIFGEPNRRGRFASSAGEVWEWALEVRTGDYQRGLVVEWHPNVDGVSKKYFANYLL